MDVSGTPPPKEDAVGWVLLGASSPIARAFAVHVARSGASLILAGRDLDSLQRDAQDCAIRYGAEVAALRFDATALDAHAAFAAECRRRVAGTLNVFCAIGAMPTQRQVESDVALLQLSLATNAVGAASILLAFARLFEAQRAGILIALGSVAGDRGRPSNYVYGMGKAGLHAFLQGLRARLAKSNAHVVTVKPGFIDTRLTFGMPGVFLVATPQRCAQACWRAASKRRNVIYVPFFWRPVMLLIRLLPEFLFKRLEL